MDTNIHNYTCNGQEMDISININRDTNDNLCPHLIEIEKLSPSRWTSTTSILHTKESSQRKWRASAMNINGSINKDKGMQTQGNGNDNGDKLLYSFLTLKVSSPPNASQWLNT